jgi:hypothetical protein
MRAPRAERYRKPIANLHGGREIGLLSRAPVSCLQSVPEMSKGVAWAFETPPRPSQATHAIPDPYPEFLNEPHSSGKLIALPVLGGVQHDYRLAA